MKSVLLGILLCFSLGVAQFENQPDSTLSGGLMTDSLATTTESAQNEQRGLKLTKRSFNHKQQVVWGAVMMAFVAIILSSTQSWNPRN